MLRLLVIILCVEIPLHKPVPEYEKDHLVDAMIGDTGYIRILRKAFVIRGDASLVVFDHVIDIRLHPQSGLRDPRPGSPIRWYPSR